MVVVIIDDGVTTQTVALDSESPSVTEVAFADLTPADLGDPRVGDGVGFWREAWFDVDPALHVAAPTLLLRATAGSSPGTDFGLAVARIELYGYRA